jgi:hypothetical protein
MRRIIPWIWMVVPFLAAGLLATGCGPGTDEVVEAESRSAPRASLEGVESARADTPQEAPRSTNGYVAESAR